MTNPGIEILDWSVEFDEVTGNGISRSFKASDKQLEAIGAANNLHSVSSFRLEVELSNRKGGIIFINGTLWAAIEQYCVVTLKPVSEKIEVTFRRLLARGEGKKSRKNRGSGKRGVLNPAEIIFDIEDADPPDIIAGTQINIGKIGLEEMVLEADPYPRHPDAGKAGEFALRESERDEVDRQSPFQEIKKLYD